MSKKPTKRTRPAAGSTTRSRTVQRGTRTPQTSRQATSRSSSASSSRRRDTSRSSSRRSTPREARTLTTSRRPLALIGGIVALLLLVVFIVPHAISCSVDTNKQNACERWRETAVRACDDTKLGSEWTDAILAMMFVESGGDTTVESVEGVAGDVMQAAEGAYGKIVKKGSKKYGVRAQTPEASIYAGALEFKANLKLWRDYLDGITPNDSDKIQLVVQGYNFGADGWHSWCKKNGITAYSVDVAQEYSDTQMPEDAKGTPAHAEKWLSAYKKIHQE